MVVPVNLEQLKKELADNKAKENQLIGKRDTLLDRLKAEFNLNSIAEAEAASEKMDEEIAAMKAEYDLLKKEFENDGK